MKKKICVWSVIGVAGMMLGLASGIGVAAETVGRRESNKRIIEKVLFIGDSITMHGPSKPLGWTGHWGMAATSEERDFVHRVYQRICRMQPGHKVELLICGRDTGKAGRIDNALNTLDELIAADADLIVVQLGENEKSHEVTKENFGAKYDRLVSALKKSSRDPLIVCTGVWSPRSPEPRGSMCSKVSKDSLIRDVCKKHGCVFVDVKCVSRREKNIASSDDVFQNSGVRWHPGNAGMEGYSEEIWAALRSYFIEMPIKKTKKLTGIVPVPQHVYMFTDNRQPFGISASTVIVLREDAGKLEEKAALLLKEDIKKCYRLDIKICRRDFSGQKSALILVDKSCDFDVLWGSRLPMVRDLNAEGYESYQLTCDARSVVVESVTSVGVLNGTQILRQMLRKDGTVPALVIAD